jgi:Pentapeptide repeats (8 copies)
MANPDHIAKLMKGAKAWNAWREENPDVQPDLLKADLSGADLSKANLSYADLSYANLSEARRAMDGVAAGARRPSCSPATRPGGLLPMSPSCRSSCCESRKTQETVRRHRPVSGKPDMR